MWKQHWLILRDNCLYYFEYMMNKESRGVMPLKNLSIRKIGDSQKCNYFELYIRNNKKQFIKAYETEADGWMAEGNHVVCLILALCRNGPADPVHPGSCEHGPLPELLAARKKWISFFFFFRSGFLLTKTIKSPAPLYPLHYLVQNCLTLWLIGPCNCGSWCPI